MKEVLDRLLDAAVSEGRCYWDLYYGHNNSYHMETLVESDDYKQLVQALERLEP